MASAITHLRYQPIIINISKQRQVEHTMSYIDIIKHQITLIKKVTNQNMQE